MSSGPTVRYLVSFAYNGLPFKGLQQQLVDGVDICRTVYGVFKSALICISPNSFLNLRVVGRTDVGVHALNSALNCNLNHPQSNKLYTTQYLKKKLNNIFMAANEFIRYTDVNIKTMEQAISLFKGTHDFEAFRSFGASNDEREIRTKRNIQKANVKEIKPIVVEDGSNYLNDIMRFDQYKYYEIEFASRGFLYHQVRRMIGASIAASRGIISLSDIEQMLQKPNEFKFNPKILIAPPYGLYLAKVDFELKDLMAFDEESPLYTHEPDGTIYQLTENQQTSQNL